MPDRTEIDDKIKEYMERQNLDELKERRKRQELKPEVKEALKHFEFLKSSFFRGSFEGQVNSCIKAMQDGKPKKAAEFVYCLKENLLSNVPTINEIKSKPKMVEKLRIMGIEDLEEFFDD